MDEEKNVLGIIKLANKIPVFANGQHEKLVGVMTAFSGNSIAKVMSKSSR